MDEKELLNNYPLFKDDDLKMPKDSILYIDNKISSEFTDKRAFLIDYINSVADDNDEMYYYDMLGTVNFIDVSEQPDHIAYTTKEQLIYMVFPNSLICDASDKDLYRYWAFTYAHECMHNLWKTFDVEEKIIKELGSCNHTILNIASDCVINDYISTFKKAGKKMPEGLITPDFIKKEFNVDYNRNDDTQFSLYLKLIDSDKAKDWAKNHKPQEGYGPPSNSNGNNPSGNNSGGQGGNQSNKDGNQNGQDSGNQGGQDGNQNGQNDNGDQNGQGGSNQGGQQGNQNGQGGDQNGQGSSRNAQGNSQSNSGNYQHNGGIGKVVKKAEGTFDKDTSGNQNNGKVTGGAGQGAGDFRVPPETFEKAKKLADRVINKYRDTISGSLGKFIKKCKSSQALQRGGLKVEVNKGGSWENDLKFACNTFLKQKIFGKKQYHETYNRIRRGERPFDPSDFRSQPRIVLPGREEIKNSIGFTMAAYVDVSYSMAGCISNVFDTIYSIINDLKKSFGKNRTVNAKNIDTKMYIFNEAIKEIKWGSKYQANGTNVEFDKILNYIKTHQLNAFLNIIITDGEYDVDPPRIIDVLKKFEGLLIVVTNNTSGVMQKLEREVNKVIPNKIKIVQAPKDFGNGN